MSEEELRTLSDAWANRLLMEVYQPSMRKLPAEGVTLAHNGTIKLDIQEELLSWKFKQVHSSGVVISKARVPGTSVCAFRGEKKGIQVSADKFYEYANGCERTAEFDAMFKAGAVLKTFWNEIDDEKDHKEKLDSMKVMYFRYKSPPVWDRDFIMFERNKIVHLATQEHPDKPRRHYVLSYQSVLDEDDDFEIPDDVSKEFWSAVRAKIFFGGWVIKDGDEPGTCDVTYIGHVDAKGWVPKKILNMVGVEQPLCVAHIENLLVSQHELNVPSA
eukprot:TRINITY_DN5570_c0_g1_i1.p1 TRINITY_DN5570_c0_g1~~TRINITY_DN5570_c0_g1_i1.p1  ORF type:complete len:293 (-),score=76.22 TRINITY_DN5570_c0_g1_i1:68-886(-)